MSQIQVGSIVPHERMSQIQAGSIVPHERWRSIVPQEHYHCIVPAKQCSSGFVCGFRLRLATIRVPPAGHMMDGSSIIMTVTAQRASRIPRPRQLLRNRISRPKFDLRTDKNNDPDFLLARLCST
ncbi:hypothetical protein M514_26772 [Trichuris suis]|uniref:Uncharacterized protein n=1 Tax=Trichuris suis TaxID=68888 RepID=A0A085MV24_9BILA|nr:hypothetical protein M514_26772 [Trichuris suis]